MKIGSKKRKAVSEIMGTLIMVTITLIAGAAVFGWVNGQASNSEGAYGQSVANNVNFLRERFVVVTQSFTGTGTNGICAGGTHPYLECLGANFWLYNSGQLGFTLSSLQIENLTDICGGTTGRPCIDFANVMPLNVLFYASGSCTAPNCGYVVYQGTSGSTTACVDTTPLGTGATWPLAQGTMTSTPYAVGLPVCLVQGGQLFLYDGIPYTFTFTGLYGNTYSTTVTVNG